MIDIAELEQYFPDPNKPIIEGQYTFTISLSSDEDENIFVINLKIKQADHKDNHLIKFRLGLGKDKKRDSAVHETHQPHFEIDIYKREEESFSATVYFTFKDTDDEKIMEYAKGTVVIIDKIINNFCDSHQLNKELIDKLIYEKPVKKELFRFESILINSLYDCYKSNNMIIKQNGEAILIKTEHNLSKCLDVDDLQPLFLPLMKKIKEYK